MSLKLLFILAVCVIYVNAGDSPASTIFYSLKLILGFSREMYKIIDIAIENGNDNSSIINDIMTSAIDEWSGRDKNSEKINKKLMDISSQLNYIVMHMDHEFGIIEKEMQELSMQLKIDPVKREIADHITNIRRHYMMTSKYSNETESYNRDELKSVMKTLTDQTSGKDVRSSLESLSDRIVGPKIGDLRSNFLELYGEYVKMEGAERCGTGLSPNNYLYNLYTMIVSTEMMGLVSLSFGYELQHKLHKNATIDKELKAAQKEREERLKTYFTNFKSAIESLPLDYRSCDPSEHNRGETFFEMEGLYQTILTEEYGKNYPDSCYGDCDTINMTSYEDNGIICGRISHCSTIENPTYCELTGQVRRYQWIKTGGDTYGAGDECSGVTKNNASYFQWSTFTWCESCRCTCEGNSLKVAEKNPNSTHVISLLPVSSDVSKNMTITGVRLRVTNGIVHIQIKEGQLQAAGQVTSNSTWKDLPDMKNEVNRARNGSSTIYQEGRDFVVVDQYHSAINLDDIMAPPGYLITGIKWGLAHKNETQYGWQRLEIQIRYTPFNFTSGALGNSSESQWMSSPTIHNQRLKLEENDSPEKSTAQNIPTQALKGVVNFIPSSLSKDAGQSTVPFLDGVPVESGSGPLTGIGLFHKAAEGYAGFLSLRLYSLDMGKYMTGIPDLPKNRDDHYKYTIDDSEQGNASQANKIVLDDLDLSGSAQRIHGSVWIIVSLMFFLFFFIMFILRSHIHNFLKSKLCHIRNNYRSI